MCCFKISSPYLFEFLLKIFDEHPILSIWEPPPGPQHSPCAHNTTVTALQPRRDAWKRVMGCVSGSTMTLYHKLLH